jgi:hypothetical protein
LLKHAGHRTLATWLQSAPFSSGSCGRVRARWPKQTVSIKSQFHASARGGLCIEDTVCMRGRRNLLAAVEDLLPSEDLKCKGLLLMRGSRFVCSATARLRAESLRGPTRCILASFGNKRHE